MASPRISEFVVISVLNLGDLNYNFNTNTHIAYYLLGIDPNNNSIGKAIDGFEYCDKQSEMLQNYPELYDLFDHYEESLPNNLESGLTIKF